MVKAAQISTGLASVTLAMAGVVGGAVPVAADNINTCSTGNSNQVVKVFENTYFNEYVDGIRDDLCWLDGSSRDETFATGESGLDDIGEDESFHDLVSSYKIRNDGTDGLCVWFYYNENRSGSVAEKAWAGPGEGVVPYAIAQHNDAYDSVDLKRISQAQCFA
jgi:hypothetical protein